MTITTVKARKFLPENMPVMAKERSGTIFMLHYSRQPLWTGLERNADIVHMATYAPLFAHVEGWQWRPDMIWFDNLNSVCTVSYYVQQLFATHKGTNVLSLTMNKKPVNGCRGGRTGYLRVPYVTKIRMRSL